MAKPNYQHAKRQKEAARLARQAEKKLRKQTKGGDAEPSTDDAAPDAAADTAATDAPKSS